MLQTCARSHGLRIKRHDRLVESIAKSLTKRGYQTEVEPRIQVGNTICKPDLVAWKDNACFVLDPQICADNADFLRYHETKSRRYDIGPVREYADSRIPVGERKILADGGTEGIRTVVQGLIIDWRGCWSRKTYDFLRLELRFPVSYLNLLSVRTLAAGRLIWNTLRSRTD
jgi:hypothetical protein